MWSGAVLALLSVYCLVWLIPQNTAPAQSDLDLSPALIPSVATGLCLVLSVVLVYRALAADRTEKALLDEEFGEEATGIDPAVLGNLVIWTAVSCAILAVMELVGFEPALALFLAAAMLFVGARRYWVIALVAVAAPVALSQLVLHVFTTELPAVWR